MFPVRGWARILPAAAATVAVALLAAVLVLSRSGSAYPGMPVPERDYWEWVATIARDREQALKDGVDLLYRYPGLRRLYPRLAELCAGEAVAGDCATVLRHARVPDDTTALYRDAALALLAEGDAAAGAWQQLAASPLLDPALARLALESGAPTAGEGWVERLEAAWKARPNASVGATFGLGYLAAQHDDYAVAESLLTLVRRRLPGDPDACRELGRVYYATGRMDRFEQTLRAGIEAATRRFDLDRALILRGNLGLGLLQQGVLDEAEALFVEALETSRRLADGRTEGFNLYRIAGVRHRQARYEEALALLDSADVRYARYVPRQQPEVWALRGSTLRALFRFTEAETVLEQTVEVATVRKNVGVQLQALVALAQVRYRMGRHEAGRATALEALTLATRYRQADAEMAARVVAGDIDRLEGRYEEARRHYRQGLQRAEETHNRVRERELSVRMGLLALNVQDANGAREAFQRVLDAVGHDADALTLARAHFGLGNAFGQYGNYRESVRQFDLALARLGTGRNGGEARMLRINLLVARGRDLAALGRYDAAEKALQTARGLVGSDASGLYRTEIALGLVRIERGDDATALAHFRRAATVPAAAVRPALRWQAAHGQALALWHGKNHRGAEVAFREAVAVVESMRESLRSSEERSFVVQDKVQVYRDYAAFLRERGRAGEAFHMAERARSRGLVDLLYTTQQERRLDLALETDRAIELNRRVRAIEQAVGAEPEAAPWADEEMDATRRVRLQREQRQADSTLGLLRSSSSPQERLYTFDPLPVDSAQALLQPGEAMVFYSIGATPDASLAYVVLPDRVVTRPLPVTSASLADVVRFFRDGIGREAPGRGWEAASRRLYRELVAPLASALPPSVRHLHVVPEGVLHYVPFAALQDPGGRFLVERYTLSVAPSASILSLCRRRNPRRWRSMLLLADPDGSLPGARREVAGIAARSPGRRLAVVGAQATAATVEALATQYDVLHFATHGRFSARAPWQSRLDLHGDDLSVTRIGQLRLDAYLVTLSACETGLSGGALSDIPEGDEWVGLNQAFLAAGTPTVMASLWPISDRVSAGFMTGFYDVLGPEGKARALAEMQRRFLRDRRTRHPYYWAAFTIIGDPL